MYHSEFELQQIKHIFFYLIPSQQNLYNNYKITILFVILVLLGTTIIVIIAIIRYFTAYKFSITHYLQENAEFSKRK